MLRWYYSIDEILTSDLSIPISGSMLRHEGMKLYRIQTSGGHYSKE